MKKLFTVLLCALLCCALLLGGCKNDPENKPTGTNGTSGTTAQNTPGGTTAAGQDDPASGGTTAPGETTTGGGAGNTPGGNGNNPQGSVPGGDSQNSTPSGNNGNGGGNGGTQSKDLLTQYNDAVLRFGKAKSYELKRTIKMDSYMPISLIPPTKSTTLSNIYADKSNEKKPVYREDVEESGAQAKSSTMYYKDGFAYHCVKKGNDPETKTKEPMDVKSILAEVEQVAVTITQDAVISIAESALPGGVGKRITMNLDMNKVEGLDSIKDVEAQSEGGTARFDKGELVADINAKGELQRTAISMEVSITIKGFTMRIVIFIEKEFVSTNQTKVKAPADLGSYTLKTT